MARLQHPNVVQIFEVGEYNGLPFLALEFVEGGSLAQRLSSGPLPPRDAARLIEQLARAVHHAHQKDIVHRDLKPANVLLSDLSTNRTNRHEGKKEPEKSREAARSSSLIRAYSCDSWIHATPKITDFGLAKKLDATGQTASGAVMGTPSYMAPEQAAGQAKAVGPAADVWALGAVLYECLTGRPPFQAPTPVDTILQVLGEEPVPVRRLQSRVPRDLETICHKCLQKDPTQRYADAEALAEDLRRFQAGEPITARPVGVVRRLVKWARRRPAAAALLGVSSLAAAALVGVISTAAAIVYGKNQDLERANVQLTNERNRAQEAEARERNEAEKARTAEGKTRAALEEVETTLIDGLLRPIGYRDVPRPDLDPAEDQALRELVFLPNDRVRVRFLERGLEKPETAECLRRRSQQVVNAAIGQDASRRQQVWVLLRARLRDKGADPRIRLACVYLGLALGDADPQFAAEAAAVALKAMGETTALETLVSLTRAVVTLAGQMDVAGLRETMQTALEQIARAANPYANDWLAQVVVGLADRMDAAGAREIIPKVLEAMNRTNYSDAQNHLALAVRALARKMDASGTREAAPKVLEAMNRPYNSPARSALEEAFSILAERLDAARVREAANMALDQMNDLHPVYLSSLSAAVSTLAGRMGAAERAKVAAAATTKVLEAMRQTTDPNALQQMSGAFPTLARWMDNRDLAALLTNRTLPDPVAKTLLPQLEGLARRKFGSIDEAAKWFRDAGDGKDAPAPRDKL